MNEVLLRLGIVFVCSLLFGLVRQKLHKPIGFGTYIFVAIGSGGLSLVAITIHTDNPLPLLGSIVTGIGFLGAGALIRNSDRITGFTSAASIWVFAIFGLLIGLGQYFLGLLIYGTTWIVMGIDMYLEKKSIGAYQKKLTVVTTKLIPTNELTKLFTGYKHKLLHVEVNKTANTMTITFYVEGTKGEINQLPHLLLNQPWFGSCKVE
ncbi:MgtC/SapB family protein [Candidatus Woesearchaeota archaeon]|nr:MgtC/SapB family protein [Candidatus Woesearchaeota archaeon]